MIRVACVLVALLLSTAGCAHGGTGPYVWANTLPDRNANDAVIRTGDLVRVSVARQEQLSVTTRVRADGRIAIPLLSDVEIAGNTPNEAAARIQDALHGFVVDPEVVVGVEERVPVKVAVLGQVNKPGMYELDVNQGVLHALAYAGGLTETADEERIFVLRHDGARMLRVRFSVALLTRGEGVGHRFSFQPGDVVMVEGD